jgi:hypothetical protein
MDESQNPEKQSISSTYDLTAAVSDLKEVCFGGFVIMLVVFLLYVMTNRLSNNILRCSFTFRASIPDRFCVLGLADCNHTSNYHALLRKLR